MRSLVGGLADAVEIGGGGGVEADCFVATGGGVAGLLYC